MFNIKCGLLLALLLLLLSVSGVCATDNNTDSLNPVGDNSLELNNTVLSVNNNVDLTNNETTNTVSNDSVDLSTVPCAVSSYINVMKSYNKTVDVETGIKETHTVDNITSVDGLVNAFKGHGLNCSVIKTNSMKDLIDLYNVSNINIITHLFIDNQYHYGHIKEIKKDGILFNNGLFIRWKLLKDWYTGITIVINDNSLNVTCFGSSINKSEWVNITGKLTQRELFNLNYGLIGKSITLNKKYVKLKAKIKDELDLKSIESGEFILFGNTLKPKMDNLLKIQKQLKPIHNNPNSSNKLLKDLNNILTPMQPNLNDTISHLNHLIKMINKHCMDNDNLKASNVVSPKVLDVPKLLGDCGEAITENPTLKQFVKNFEDSVNKLNPLNARPEWREYFDEKYGLDSHKFGFFEYYTLKSI